MNPTASQAIRACILAQFLTKKSYLITVFEYLQLEKLIRIKAVSRTGQIKIVVNELGKFKYV